MPPLFSWKEKGLSAAEASIFCMAACMRSRFSAESCRTGFSLNGKICMMSMGNKSGLHFGKSGQTEETVSLAGDNSKGAMTRIFQRHEYETLRLA